MGQEGPGQPHPNHQEETDKDETRIHSSTADDVWVKPAGGVRPRTLAPSREMHWGPSRVEGAPGGVQHVCSQQLVSRLVRVQQHKWGLLSSSQGPAEAWDLGIVNVAGHSCSGHPAATNSCPRSHHAPRQQEDRIIDGAEEWGYLLQIKVRRQLPALSGAAQTVQHAASSGAAAREREDRVVGPAEL